MRRFAIAAPLVATGLTLGASAYASGNLNAPHLAVTGIIVGSGLALARRSLFAQVMARGPALLVLGGAAISTLDQHFALAPVLATLATALTLVLAQPLLNTAEARAEFAPLRARSALLAVAACASAAGLLAGVGAVLVTPYHPAAGLACAALTATLFGSIYGVLRMRAWGVLLGALGSAVALVAALASASGRAPFFILAIPGMLYALVIAMARRAEVASPSKAEGSAAVTSGRLRFADVADDSLAEAEVEAEAEAAMRQTARG